MVKLTFYGGVGEIGGNKVLLEDGDTRLFFDFGMSFGKRYQYFEEYLKPRPSAGLLDPLAMGLLPPLRGLYRDDLEQVPAGLWHRYGTSPHYRDLRGININGVLLSHAHLDHSGYISFLRGDIPIYSTAMTAFIAKAMQDSGKGDFEKEVCYSIPREKRGGVLQSADWRNVAAEQRQFRLLDQQSLSLEGLEFWQSIPGRRGIQPQPLEAADKVGSLSLRYFPVDHSVFGASAFATETSSGWIVYTGDLRLHGRRGYLSEEFIQAAAKLKPTILLCEGTNIDASEATATEEEVYNNALKVVEAATALVIADFGPRNIERLLSFHRIAQESDRCLVVLAKDAYLLQAMHYASPEVPDITWDRAIAIYKDAKAKLDNWERGIRSAPWAKLVTPGEISRNQEAYILCFSFFDINELPSLMPREGSIYIYSSSEAHNEEQELDIMRLSNWLKHFGIRGIGLPPEEEHGFHASGHASGPELIDLIQRINPKTLIPIHSEKPQCFTQGLKGTGIEVLIPIEGQMLTFPA